MTLDQAVQQVLPSVRADLERLVRIPSMSADPDAAPQLRSSAALVAALLEAAGLPEVDVLSVPDGPAGRRRPPPGPARRAHRPALRAPRRTAPRRPGQLEGPRACPPSDASSSSATPPSGGAPRVG